MLDIKFLIITSFLSLFILLFISLFILYKYPQKRYSKYFLLFSIFFLIGEFLVIFRNVMPDFLTIVMSNTLFMSGYIFLYIAIRLLLGFEARWHRRYCIPIIVSFMGFWLFTYNYYDLSMRVIIFSIFCVLYGSLISLLFLKKSKEDFSVINKISALIFFLGVILFLIRTFLASIIELPPNYLNTTDIMIISVYVYLFFTTIWLGIIQLIYTFKKI